jgi:xylulokinase
MSPLIGIDLGTTGCKAAVYGEDGDLLGESYLEYGLITLSATQIEQDPAAWWDLACQAVNCALASADVDRLTVRGIAVSSQGISFVPVDRQGKPLTNAISWLDSRAIDEADEVLDHFSPERVFATTGKRSAPFYVLPKLLWVRKHNPDVWRQTCSVLTAHDYLALRLCGQQVTDHSMAGGTLLYDLQAADWWAECMSVFDMRESLFVPIRWSGTPIDTLTPEAARALDLPRTVVVSVGGQDQKCAALGAGIQDERATVSLGTASAISQMMNSPRTDPEMRVPTSPFVQPDRWVLEGVVGTGAASLRWYRDALGTHMSYDEIAEEACAVPAGADGVVFYPHLSGAGSPHWQSLARGSFHGLSLATSRGHLTRAVLEGVAYQIRENLAITEELAGPVEDVMLFGGGAKSAVWRDIIGDVINRPVSWTSSAETASLGAAMLAGVGCGTFTSLSEAHEAMTRAPERRYPHAPTAAQYAETYERYRQLERILLDGDVPLDPLVPRTSNRTLS